MRQFVGRLRRGSSVDLQKPNTQRSRKDSTDSSQDNYFELQINILKGYIAGVQYVYPICSHGFT